MDPRIRDWIETHGRAIEDEVIRVCEVPAPTFHESRRAAYVRSRLAALGLTAEQDEAGNVLARIPGTGGGLRTLVVAHLDTVFDERVDVRVRREGRRLEAPGVGDDSAGVAALLSLVRLLRDTGGALAGDLLLGFTVGEEGLGDLRGMRALMDRLATEVDQVVAVDGEMQELVTRAVGSRRYRVRVTGPGGHSWSDFGRPSAVHLLAGAVTRLAKISLPDEPPTTLNVGTFHGGSAVNAIAASAEILIDLRSVEEQALADLEARVVAVLRAWAEEVQRLDCTVARDLVGDRPAGTSDNGPLVRALTAVARELELPLEETAASTDASVPLHRGVPAVCLGVYRGGGAHTPYEWIDADSLGPGLTWLYQAVRALQGAR